MLHRIEPGSLWQATVPQRAYPTLQGDEAADVLIVGAGLTGLTAAALLAQAGKQVIVIDRRDLGGGVTGSTTAHITAILDTRFYQIANDFGSEGAKLAAQSHLEAIEQIAGLVSDYGIDCEFLRVPGCLYTESDRDIDMLHRELDVMLRAGLPVSGLSEVGLPFPIKYAIEVGNQALFNPLKYLYGLADAISGQGVTIYENTAIGDVKEEDGRVWATVEGGSVSAGALIYATHIPPGLKPVDTQVAPYRSYVIACKTDHQYPVGLFWDTARPYNYIRTYHDGEETWLIVGGKDHKTGQEADTQSAYQALERYVRGHFQLRSIEYRWSAQVYEPVDGLAYIGVEPGAERIYYATGYAGNGMTYANVAARLLTDLILDRPTPYAELYSPSRFKPAASITDFVAENVNAAARLIGDRLAEDAEVYGDVANGEGKIVRVNGEQIAAYRDPHGVLHRLSPVCPHMKCIVHWNTAEKSWDCPCHGARYTATGEWIEGPAKHALTKIE